VQLSLPDGDPGRAPRSSVLPCVFIQARPLRVNGLRERGDPGGELRVEEETQSLLERLVVQAGGAIDSVEDHDADLLPGQGGEGRGTAVDRAIVEYHLPSFEATHVVADAEPLGIENVRGELHLEHLLEGFTREDPTVLALPVAEQADHEARQVARRGVEVSRGDCADVECGRPEEPAIEADHPGCREVLADGRYVTEEVLDELMKEYHGPDDLTGEEGLLKQLTRMRPWRWGRHSKRSSPSVTAHEEQRKKFLHEKGRNRS
jgi:hypothetical protein